MGSRVVVFGGTGFFGRYLVEDLLAHTDATITVASRHTRDWFEHERRVVFAPCDVYAYETVRSLVDRHDLVIHCAGPFQYLPLHPLSAAIELRRNYIDLSEGREFYRRVGALERQIDLARITVLTGISIVPALQMLLVEIVRPLLDTLTIIRTHLAPGTYRNRGPAMFHTMLMGVGTPFPL
jgi:saccharopine dehydrogenase-like NADP-dependent oxidoreductase